jgi:DNA primase
MTPDALADKLLLSGYECRIRGKEVVLHTCTECGNDRWNLELWAEGGLFKCWACGASGRLERFLRTLTGDDSVHIPVTTARRTTRTSLTPTIPNRFFQYPAWEMESARIYLGRRGLREGETVSYGLTVCVEKGHLLDGRIVIPLLDYWSQETIGYAGRSYTNRRPKYLSTLARRQITGWRVVDRHKACVLVEGPFDGITVHRAGFNAAVLGGTHLAIVAEFIARLSPEIPVVIMLDGSAQEEAKRLTAQVQAVRIAQGGDVLIITLPEESDPANYAPEVLHHLLQTKIANP